jgi:integrase
MARTRIEPGLYLQSNGVYGTYLTVNGKPRYKTVGRKLGEARRQRDLLRAKAHQGELPGQPKISFKTLATGWLQILEAQVAAGERGPRTLENYTYFLNKHLLPALGHRPVHAITTDELAQLINDLRGKGLAPKTIAGALVPLGRILNHALRRGYINDNPLRRLERHERPRVHRHEQRVLNHDQIALLLQHTLPTYKPLLATALYTGMRLSELLGLTWAEIDFADEVIRVRYQLSRGTCEKPAERVRLKTPAALRDIPLLPQLAALLKRHKLASRYSTDSDYVFASATGTPLAWRNVERRGLRHAADKANLNPADKPRLRVHDLRHTYASHLITELRLDPAHVSKLLGHARPSITLDTYTHLFNHAAHANDIRTRMAQSPFANLIATEKHAAQTD